MKSDTNPLWQSHNNTRQSPPEALNAQRQCSLDRVCSAAVERHCSDNFETSDNARSIAIRPNGQAARLPVGNAGPLYSVLPSRLSLRLRLHPPRSRRLLPRRPQPRRHRRRHRQQPHRCHHRPTSMPGNPQALPLAISVASSCGASAIRRATASTARRAPIPAAAVRRRPPRRPASEAGPSSTVSARIPARSVTFVGDKRRTVGGVAGSARG